MLDRIKREPVLISVIVGNLIALAAAFGLQLNEAQTAAVMGFVSTVVVIVFGRGNATPNVDVAVVDKGDGPVAANASPVTNGAAVDVIEVRLPNEAGVYVPKHSASPVTPTPEDG